MHHISTQSIETDRLILRKVTLDDAESMFRNWANDPEVTKFLSWSPHGNVNVTRQFIRDCIRGYQKNDFYVWIIERKQCEPIGMISAVRMDEKVDAVEVGYCLSKSYWHQGIMTEAFHAVIDFLFEKVGANRVAARHDPDNPHSGDVMKKCGLRYEGTLRQSQRSNMGIRDAKVYAILREEWKPLERVES